MTNMPQHIAIIMDGNGRWAKQRHLNVTAGHRAGAQTLRRLAVEAEKMGLRYLTIYAFSTENWTRPRQEVDGLMRMLRDYIQQYIDDTKKNDMRISVIGDTSVLDAELRRKIDHLVALTEYKTGLHVVIAINYGGRDEIVRATKKIAQLAAKGQVAAEDIDQAFFTKMLDTAALPDPDLLIRTGGEFRLSNFLLWQISYTEMYVIPKYWPDFTAADLQEAVDWYNDRERRFGARRPV